MGNLYGKYFSFTSASLAAGTDLIAEAERLSGQTGITAKKLTIIASGSLSIDVNNLGANSTLFQDSDLYYKLSLGANDCLVGSLVVGETTASPVFLAMVF